jgi:AraC-like DNA-binding protein
MDKNTKTVHISNIMKKKLIKKEIAELISAYELSLNMHICINAFTGKTLELLPHSNQYHNNPCCNYVKNLDKKEIREKCNIFDNGIIPETIKLRRKGIWKLCHGELLEYVAGIYNGDVLAGKISFGQFRPAPDLDRKIEFVYSRFRSLKTKLDKKMWLQLQCIDLKKLKALEIVFNSLASEISRLLEDKSFTGCSNASRRENIDYFIGRRLGDSLELSDLAEYLDLSTSRTGAIVREIYGKGFAVLLRQRRIEYACELLNNTSLCAIEIATLCGFEDPAYFHRCFKKTSGLTTKEYRKLI